MEQYLYIGSYIVKIYNATVYFFPQFLNKALNFGELIKHSPLNLFLLNVCTIWDRNSKNARETLYL